MTAKRCVVDGAWLVTPQMTVVHRALKALSPTRFQYHEVCFFGFRNLYKRRPGPGPDPIDSGDVRAKGECDRLCPEKIKIDFLSVARLRTHCLLAECSGTISQLLILRSVLIC